MNLQLILIPRKDNVKKNYSVDWLPRYDELRTELICAWRLMERRRKEEGKHQKNGHPALPILPGHDQPGPHQRKCYGCGEIGHMRGDSSCAAGPNGVWDGAPQVWKDRVKKSGNKGGAKGQGKGKGAPQQRNKGKRDGGDKGAKEKQPCHNWSRGNGFCKYAEACRYSHDGPKGGQGKPNESGLGKRKGDAVFLATKKGKKARKKLTSLLLKDLKEDGGEKGKDKANDSDDDDHLYQLIRGVPTVMIKSNQNTKHDYVPVRQREVYNSDDDIDEDKDFNERDEARDYSVEIIDGMRYLQYESKAGQSNLGKSPEDKAGQSNRERARGLKTGQSNRGNSRRGKPGQSNKNGAVKNFRLQSNRGILPVGKPGQSNKKGGATHFTVTLMQTSASSGMEVKDEYVPSRRDDKRPMEDSKSNDENNGRVIKDSCEKKRKKNRHFSN